MSYIINTTNGSILTTLVDGTRDISTTSISLIGKNYTGFGESINENFVNILENFANTSAPSAPLAGQLWWDTSESRLKVYDGTTKSWRTSGGPILSSEEPIMVAGDLWIDTFNRQIYFKDSAGLDPVLVGPSYKNSQGKTGLFSEDIINDAGLEKTVSSLYVAGLKIAIVSKETITPNGVIVGLTGDIKPGINYLNVTGETNPKLIGTATNAESIGGVNISNLLRGDSNDQTVGTLRIKNDGGLSIGNAQPYHQILINGTRDTIFKNSSSGSKISFELRNAQAQSETAIDINPSARQIKFYPVTGDADVNVNGDLTVEGDLTVNGSTTTVNSTELSVDDKNIELAATDSPSDAIAAGGGIILKGSSDHSIIWNLDIPNGDYWTVNDHLNLTTGKAFKINNTSILDAVRLHNSVTESNLQTLGDLNNLQINNGPFMSGNNISTTASLTFDVDGIVTFTNNTADINIRGIANPAANNDVANKAYVDLKTRDTKVSLSFDATNYNVGPYAKYDQSITQTWLQQIAPASDRNATTTAALHCIFYLPGGIEREVRRYVVSIINNAKTWDFQGVENISQP
jgi:hypothetical protein